ncbi:aminoglycoside phosphotransferase [Sphingobium jiangsuense]|uniref:Catechol 2,3-dioxygenase-like lactoylglutathione lyase family enzyme n=1 Tax=Sphingobium jiangsuense TaxID=870476 RepID=A0A7W6FPT0_9SPHN|nr:phosphotransferase [Sphingobium jiangsuense]MBB3925932.1 catechol 2,3-dioxygenase-like lactoylglutathione lyase family enzyme [Sphingobium jiangsuense]GLS98644.1 aminoglycoside phosphotransferase [Sphingobium jiangsuense]
MAKGRLPLTVEEVTADWLGEALSARHPGVAVERLEVGDILWGTGTKMMARVAYNEAGRAAGLPDHLCIKAGLAEHRELVKFCYQTEARFFDRLAPQLSMGLPRILFAADDADQGMVVMEDLRHAGARICRVQEPLDKGAAAAFLDDLAALHARWWNSPALEDDGALGWLMRHDPLPDEQWGDFGRGQLQPATWDRYMALPRALAVPARCRDRVTMAAALQALRRYGRRGPVCVIHGDAHLGNMYIRADGGPGFLDWQTTRRGHWAQDVAYFYISALDPLDRRTWEQELIAGYLAALARHGVADPPGLPQAWEAIRAHIVYGLFYWMVNPVEWQAEENNAATAPRFGWAAVDHHAPPVGPIQAGGA